MTAAKAIVLTVVLLATSLCGCTFITRGWSPSAYRSRQLPPDRIECWQPGEHWSEKGQSCHDVRSKREDNQELP